MSRTAAFFDVDGTIVRGNIVAYYAFIRMHPMNKLRRKLWIASFAARVPVYYFLDKFSRRLFSLLFYRNYKAIPPADLKRRAQAHFDQVWSAAVYPQAIQCIRAHQAAGRDIVLVSGSLEEIIEPLARRIGECRTLACRLHLISNNFSGKLSDGPLTGPRKAEAIRRYARESNIDLAGSYGYADSADDIPMLESVGSPHAVNPGHRLRRVARRRHWPILTWKVEN